MTRKHFLSAFGILIVLLTIGLLIVVMLSDAPTVTKAKFDRIGHGMTLVEVEAIFDGDGGTKLQTKGLAGFPQIPPDDQRVFYAWEDKNGSAVLVIFEHDCVISKEGDFRETPIQRIGRWLGRH